MFKEELRNYIEYINLYIDKEFSVDDSYEHKLKEAMRYAMVSSAKRIRPVLMMASYKLFKENYDVCMPFALSLEMIHNFSLIHDDLPSIDNDDIRHSKNTVHKEFSESTAILTGDTLLNRAYLKMSNEILNNQKDMELKIRALNEIASGTQRMCIGEFLDIEWENTNILIEQLKYMHMSKTGALICAAVRCGAMLAGACDEDIEKLTEYAKNIGLAFQIKDDILSEEGSKEIMGKPVGNDKRENKCTYVSIFGVKKAQKLLKESIDSAVDIISEYGQKSEFLKELAIYIMERDH